ncbi:MAG: hypothetical protein GXY55_20795 [Phycisphaerae bacterium]|nr:hypothetical protein [Phycisphaerae bacterium]
MLRKIILVVATFALACVAFAIYQWRDEATGFRRATHRQVPTLQPKATPLSSATQAADRQSPALLFKDARIPPGERSVARLYDPSTGEARIIFQTKEWEPVSDTELYLREPSARVLLPGGQLAYVRSDEGNIKVQIDDNGNVNPKSGRFVGHVSIFVDLSDPEERRKNSDSAQPEQHPEAVVRIWLDDASFDLDLARLQSDGDVLVQSSRGSIEGRGLELAWSEVDRRVKLLRVVEGRRATLQGPGLKQFGALPGDTAEVVSQPGSQPADPAGEQPSGTSGSNATGTVTAALPGQMQPKPAAGETPTQGGQSFHTSPGATISFLEPERGPSDDRIDTYQLIFRDQVVARQKDGIKVLGELRADVLTVLADFGREERGAVQQVPNGQSAQSAPARSSPDDSKGTPLAQQDSGTTIELLWTGEVLLKPVPSPTTREADPDTPKRFHLLAEGDKVTVRDARQGAAVCRRLEYHMEDKRIWLTGAPGLPVELLSGPDSRITVERSLFFDYPTGIAKIEGAGQMVRRRTDAENGASPIEREASGLRMALTDSPGDVRLAWTERGELRFDRTKPSSGETTEATAPGQQQVTYLKHATFVGGVDMSMPGQSVAADLVEVSFLPPIPGEDKPSEQSGPLPGGLSGDRLTAEHILATGRVRMSQDTSRDGHRYGPRRTDLVTCDRLDVRMTVDEGGRNVPSQGRASGEVVARQTVQDYRGPIPWGPPQLREIRAGEEMIIEMASVPRPVTDTERERLEAYGRRQGYTPDSPEWQRQVQRLQSRRDIIITQLIARGDVAASDARQNLNDLAGSSLECSFDQTGQMTKALILGWPDRPAYVDHNTFAIRGQQLSLDMTTESVEVPGEGMLRFYNDQDLDGRSLRKPIPVVVAWDRQMWLRGQEDAGTFTGNVRVTSENNVLEAQEMRLRFSPAPKAEVSASAPAAGIPRLLASMARGARDADRRPQNSAPIQRVRKRLERLDAFGDAVILSSAYQEPAPQTTAVARFVASLVPEALLAPAPQPTPSPGSSRLLSRVRLAGPRMRIDLAEEQLLVEGEGNLLVEDYRLPTSGTRRQTAAAGFLSGDALPGLDGGGGPSQTLFTWENSMTFLNKNNIAVFDRKVVMRHRAGEEMVLAGQLEAALKLDEAVRRRIRSRTANLTCDNLRAEFQRNPSRKRLDSSPLSQATSLHGFRAWGNVYLMDHDAKAQRTASGTIIAYNRASGLVEVGGSASRQAVIEETDAATGRLNGHWNGDSLEWNLNTGIIQTRRGSILR